jgi:hypothetical protein
MSLRSVVFFVAIWSAEIKFICAPGRVKDRLHELREVLSLDAHACLR